MPSSSMRPRARLLRFVAAVVAGAGILGPLPAADSAVATCQGFPATIVGPNEGINTWGTAGEDVIVAPLEPASIVRGGAGDDLICLVDGSSDQPSPVNIKVYAGDGDDSVVNESTSSPDLVVVQLGAGADSFLGADYREDVDASTPTIGGDTDVDAIETGDGYDTIRARGIAGEPNPDVVRTGPGRDRVYWTGTGGGTIDNGLDADSLLFTAPATGQLEVDNVARQLSLDGTTMVSWTSVDTFEVSVQQGSRVSFTGSAESESVRLTSPPGSEEPVVSTSAIGTGGGDDAVLLLGYLPGSVNLGEGHDTLTHTSCVQARIEIAGPATCSTQLGAEATTNLAGVDYLRAYASLDLTVIGSGAGEEIRGEAAKVRVHAGGGRDRVSAFGQSALITGGGGNDLLRGDDVTGGVVIYGRGGNDYMYGSRVGDRLLGGRGIDEAHGRRGTDRCVAEARLGCELR